MRAVVLGETPWSLRVADGWPEPEPGSGQVVVRVRGVGICGSDLALVSGRRRPPAYPWVPGHEAFGEIVAAGAGVDPAGSASGSSSSRTTRACAAPPAGPG